AEMMCNQLEASKDECPHQDLAQFRVGLDEREQLLPGELDHLAWLSDPQARYRRTSANHVAFAGELPGLTPDDERLGCFARADRLEFASQDHEEWERPVADFDEHLARRGRAPASVPFNPRHLPRCQRWKEMIKTRDGCRKRRLKTISCTHG